MFVHYSVFKYQDA